MWSTGDKCVTRAGLDQTSVAYGQFNGNDVAYLAAWEDAAAGVERQLWLWRVDPDALPVLQYARLAIDPAMSGVVAPELRTDQLGRVWMAATTTDGTGPADIQLCLVQGDTCVYVGKVNSEPMNPWPILPLAGLPPGLRTGAAIDFAVNVRTTEPLLPTELRFAYHVGPATPGTAIRIHVSTCSFAVGSTGVTCTHVPA